MPSEVNILKEDVRRLCLPGGRMPGSEGHEIAAEYVIQRFEELGLAPYAGGSFRLPYHAQGEDFNNLMAVVEGTDPDRPPVLIAAHYDSVLPAPCADDNAAAVAIALATAARLVSKKPARNVLIAIFDAEEPPYFLGPSMGSFRFYEDQMKPEGVHAAVVMDLVGHDVVLPYAYLRVNRVLDALARWFPRLGHWDIPLPVLRSMLFGTGAESHPALEQMLRKTRIPRGLRFVSVLNEYVGDMSDHAVFRQAGVPYLFLSCGHWPHYHMSTDTPDRLNYRKMRRIMRFLTGIAESLCQTPLPAVHEPADTLDYEIHTLRRSLGPLLPLLMRVSGIKELKSREEMDALVRNVRSIGI